MTEKPNEKSKTSNNLKHIPKDAQVIMSIMKDMDIAEYEPRVINQLLEFTYRKLPLFLLATKPAKLGVTTHCEFRPGKVFCFITYQD